MKPGQPPANATPLRSSGRAGISISKDRLESHLHGRTQLVDASVVVESTTYLMTHPASADALFTEEEFAIDERIPYWADLWPSATALAKHIAVREISGSRIVELGCGIGLPSVVALDHGADVLATDHYPEALDFAAYNAKSNTGRELRTSVLDWNDSPEDIGELDIGKFDIVMAADVLYERKNVSVMADLIPRLLSENGEMILADPARPGGSFFIEEMAERGYDVTPKETKVSQDGRKVPVMVYEIRG